MIDQELVDAIERIVVAGVAMTNAALVRSRPNLELTLQQWRVLVVLGDSPSGRPMAEISRLIDVTLPATSRQLRRLEERGLVTLEPDTSDRRVTRARLTDVGLSARASIMTDRRMAIAESVRDLGAGPELVERLAGIAASLESSGTRRPAVALAG